MINLYKLKNEDILKDYYRYLLLDVNNILKITEDNLRIVVDNYNDFINEPDTSGIAEPKLNRSEINNYMLIGEFENINELRDHFIEEFI